MGAAAGVRASRDGDRYHYYWAATRALRLLDLTGDLAAVTVEGLPDGEQIDGEEVVDIGEYFGGHNGDTASEVHFTQVKHSTLRAGKPIVASELETTLRKFATIYRTEQQLGRAERLRFAFVANRRLNEKVARSLVELAQGQGSFSHPSLAKSLRGYLAFGTDVVSEAEFCALLDIQDGSPDLVEMGARLRETMYQYLPGAGTGTELSQLMEMVSLRATSLADSQTIERRDVLLALRVTEEELFPAASALEQLERPILTPDLDTVTAQLVDGADRKLILTAVGGVGKSILTSMLGDALPDGSATVVYDCFAGGDYRKATSRRHQHRVALTQLSNEVAARGLCTPLVPADGPAEDYVKVFMRRVQQAAVRVAQRSSEALLTVVVDAADNSAMAAEELQQRSFITDLLREEWPPNARLVALSRPERSHLLDAPQRGVAELPLAGFGLAETLQHLQLKFPDATDAHARELHVLSSGNPRVQAMAMEGASSVAEALAAIQIANQRPGEALDVLLDVQVKKVADDGHLRRDELTALCEALATLHPAIPLADLADITEVHADAIRSFATALGRGLFVTDSTIQFRDEPTESWFRHAHGLGQARLRTFAHRVANLAAQSPYLANALPQLLLEADLLDELVELALSTKGLPGKTDDLQAQEIARSRARFALSATLRAGQHLNAALLAIKTGDLSSGRSRKLALFRRHTDLVARFMGAELVEELCASRELATNWPGSNLHVEAALLSHIDSFKDLSRARLRSAMENMIAILRAPDDESRVNHDIDADAVADLAMAALNLEGPSGARSFISRWRPDEFVRGVTYKLASRLADAGRYDDLDLLIAQRGPSHIAVAVADVMYAYNISPSARATRVLARLLRDRKSPFASVYDPLERGPDSGGVTWALIHCLRQGVTTEANALCVLAIQTPSHLADYIGSPSITRPPTSALLALALASRLAGAPFDLVGVASPKMAEQLAKEQEHTRTRQTHEFRSNIEPLLPLVQCWLDYVLDGPTEEVERRYAAATTDRFKPISSYDTPVVLHNAVAEVATRILSVVGDEQAIDAFTGWLATSGGHLAHARPAVARIACRTSQLEPLALAVVGEGAVSIQRDRTDADTRVESLVALARTILAANEYEAEALFRMAVEEAEHVGDDLHDRWHALTTTAQALATGTEPRRAYRLFQIAEVMDRSQDLHVVELGQRLHAMHEPTYLTVTSRARDRRSLHFRSMISSAFQGPSTSTTLRPAQLSLYAFDPPHGWRDVVERLSPSAQPVATAVLEAFTRYERSPVDTMHTSSSRLSLADEPERDSSPPSVRFAGHDFTTDDDWSDALGAIAWRREERQQLVDFALDKHPTKRPQVLLAVSRSPRAHMTEFGLVAEAAAQRPMTAGLRTALAQFAAKFAIRFAHFIATSTYDEGSIAEVARFCGTTTAALRSIAFKELGVRAHELSYADCFRLAGLLAGSVAPHEAAHVFDALAELFDDLAPPTDVSDGPYEDLPEPPSEHSSCVAGLIWAALGDMSAKTRWQAAHAVLLLVQLGCQQELDALAAFADGTKQVTPFVDARLPFYSLHARMWLLHALARASREPNASSIAPFADWLAAVVHARNHATNQVLAHRALKQLVDEATIAVTDEAADALSVRVFAGWTEMDYKTRHARPNPLQRAQRASKRARERFFFDFEGYWCREVAEVFASNEHDVAQRAAEVATNIDGYELFAAERDPRRDAGIYGEGRSYSHHGDWPEEESISFYVAVHALQAVAAELAVISTAYKDPDSSQDAYTEWLAHFLPRRPDGRWLADRRDAPPSPDPEAELVRQGTHADWPWNMNKADFELVAGIGRDWITVHAYVDTDHDDLSEEMSVESALVPEATARSLLVALQTCPAGPRTFHLPTADDHSYPDQAPYDLLPWLDSSQLAYGLDSQDERGADVTFPPTRPTREVIEQFGLTADDDMRQWLRDGTPALRSRIWKNTSHRTRDREDGTRGEQLEASLDFLQGLMRANDRYLVLRVGLRRQRRRPSHERRKDHDDDFEWLDWSGKTYLIDPDGRWHEH